MPNYKLVMSNEQGEWGVNILLYSKGGAGKTTLACTLADSEYGAPVLVVDAEGGTRVISHRDDITIIPVTDMNPQGANGFGWGVIQEVANDIAAGRMKRFKTIIFDNMSEYIDLCIRHVIRTISRPIEAHHRPDQNDWGKATSEMLLFTRRMRDYARTSGTNIIFIAWEIDVTNDNGQVLREGLLFNPALARKIPGIVDTVALLTVEGKSRELTLEPSSRTDAKFRRNDTELANQIPGVIRWTGKENAPLVHIIATLKGNVRFPIEKYRPPTPQVIARSARPQPLVSQEEKKEA